MLFLEYGKLLLCRHDVLLFSSMEHYRNNPGGNCILSNRYNTPINCNWLSSHIYIYIFILVTQKQWILFFESSSCLCRFLSITERYFTELNSRRVEARTESLNIIHGMRYLKLEVCSGLSLHKLSVLILLSFRVEFSWMYCEMSPGVGVLLHIHACISLSPAMVLVLYPLV